MLTAFLAFGSLLTAIRMGRPSWLNPPPQISGPASPSPAPNSKRNPLPVSEPILGFLDMRDGKPTLFATEGSELEVSGWTACSVPGSTLSEVIVLVDGMPRGKVHIFSSRPDVAAAFGRSDFEMSGWRTAISLAGFKVGEHTLTAQGVGSHGEKGTLPAFRLDVLQ